MGEKIYFQKIHNQNIFNSDFDQLDIGGHGTIEFKKFKYTPGGMAVLYAPNGTGKTSLTKTLEISESSEEFDYSLVYKGSIKGPADGLFHVIGDQITRNIIPDNTSGYLMGSQIQKEIKLDEKINSYFTNLFSDAFGNVLKNTYGMTTGKNIILTSIQHTNPVGFSFIASIVNKQKKGKDIERGNIISFVKDTSNKTDIITFDSTKKAFIIKNAEEKGLVSVLLKLNLEKVGKTENVQDIERHDDAVKIASKYQFLRECVVCDSKNIDPDNIIKKKKENRKRIYESLSKEAKKIVDAILNNSDLDSCDPFEIKKNVNEFVSTGDALGINKIKTEIRLYIDNIGLEIVNLLIREIESSSIVRDYENLLRIQNRMPEIEDEDMLLIMDIINHNIKTVIEIKRDTEHQHRFKILMGDKDFLGKERSDLHLSTGEQNFISLAFELLLARNSNKDIVVLDDPISSFDSVYKNKIAFCIIKFLEKKNTIVLTHNTDLIRLLDVQVQNCFNLYMFNNVEDGKNGFIFVDSKERSILINLYKLLEFFRGETANLGADYSLNSVVLNKRYYLMSMIPFLRGYSHILPKGKTIYSRLSNLMHGYNQKRLNVATIYKRVFGVAFDAEYVTNRDIIELDCDSIPEIIDETKFPLLADTLKQTLIYYHLRMMVENVLVKKFKIKIKKGEIFMLSDIIQKAFSENGSPLDLTSKKYKAFFISRKTLMNEFNHFEGNMNIFQPAIDITASSLKKEVDSINQKLNEVVVEVFQ